MRETEVPSGALPGRFGLYGCRDSSFAVAPPSDRRVLLRLASILLLVSALPVVVSAQQPGGQLNVVRPWARATPPGATVGGAFVLIVNAGAQDRLLRIESPVCSSVEIHESSMKDGVMQMRELPSVAVPAHGQLKFAPGRLHIMLLNLKSPLVEGRQFPMTLVFQNAGAIKVDVIVKGLGAEEGS